MVVNLKSTEDGSTLSINTFTISRSNKGGERLQVYGQWVIKDVWNLIFSNLKTEDRDTLVQFLIDNRCACIKYTNEYGEIWEGFLTGGEAKIVQLARFTGNTNCNTAGDNRLWEMIFEYEGIKQ